MNKTAKEQAIGTAIGTGLELGLNTMIPGLGSIASPLIGGAISSELQSRAHARAYNDLGSATTQTNNPYMKNGGYIKPVTKIWSKYGGEEGKNNLKKRMQQGGYLGEDEDVSPDNIKMMQQDLMNQGYDIGEMDGVAGNKTLSALMDMDEMPTQEQQPVEEETQGTDLSQYSVEQLQQALKQLEGKNDDESQQLMQMIAQELQSRQSNQPTNQSQPMMKYGGAIVGMPDLAEYIGNSHAKGGILVDSKGNPTTEDNAVAEVEGGEMRLDLGDETYIFSKRLKI